MNEANFDKLLEKDPSFLRLSRDIERGRVLHAILLTGSDKAYLEQFARAIVSCVLEKTGQVALAEKAKRGSFLDLLILKNDKSIKTEDISTIVQKASEHGIECDQKFCIIADAEKMTEEAQNKLLKTLEEPSSDQYFILCSPSRFLLLPTIVSRCNTIEVFEHEKADVAKFVSETLNVDLNSSTISTELALGNVLEALSGVGKTNETMELALSSLTAISSSSDCLRYATKFQKANFEQLLIYLEYLVVDALKLKHGVEKIWFESRKSKIEEIAKTSDKGLLFVQNQISEIKKLVSVNVSSAFLSDKLALSIAEGKHL